MIEIKPFKALVYNQKKIKDLTLVTCPPYDVISPEAQKRYLSASPYNICHLILGEDFSNDSLQDNRYSRAAQTFNSWLENQILIKDSRDCIYFYEQQYILRKEKRLRRGFIAAMRLMEEKEDIHYHEHTMSEPKEDRFKLLKEVKANLSPIFVLFEDSQRQISRIYDTQIKEGQEFINITDEAGTVHKLWRISDEATLNRLKDNLKTKHIFIADGHHRYEVAKEYADFMKGKGDVNYILTYFTNVDALGLTILPVHRVIKKAVINIDRLSENFYIDKVKNKTEFVFMVEKSGLTEHAFGLYTAGGCWLLRLKNEKILDKINIDKSKVYKRLDVTILNYLILKPILNLDFENNKNIIYTNEAQNAIGLVDSRQASAAFLLNPVKIDEVKRIALLDERMPAKSTFFYPKLLSGLVINRFNEDTS